MATQPGIEPNMISNRPYLSGESKWIKFKMPELTPKEQIEKMFNEALTPIPLSPLAWPEWRDRIKEEKDYPL